MSTSKESLSGSTSNGGGDARNGEASSSSTNNNTDSTTEKLCDLCSVEPVCNEIEKNFNYQKMMTFYFEALEVDAKPKDITAHSICTSCFESLVEFYDTNDVLVILEKQLKTHRHGLINKSVKGIKSLISKEKTLLPIHKRIIEKWPELKEEPKDLADGVKKDDEGESFQTYLENRKSNKHKSKAKTESSPASAASSDKGIRHKRTRSSETSEGKSTESPNSKAGTSTPSKRSTRNNRNNDEKSDSDRVSDDHRNGDTTDEADDEENVNKCQICLDVFPNRKEVTQHLKDHSGLKGKFQCRNCKRPFGKANELLTHKKVCQTVQTGRRGK